MLSLPQTLLTQTQQARRCCRPDNSVMVTDIVSYMSDTDAMSHCTTTRELTNISRKFPGLFGEKRDVDILHVNYEAEISINREKKTKTVSVYSIRTTEQDRTERVSWRCGSRTQNNSIPKYRAIHQGSISVITCVSEEHHEIFELRKKQDQNFSS